MNTRLFVFTLLGICLLAGLVAGIFSRSIEAALSMPRINTIPTATPTSIPAQPTPTQIPPTPSPVAQQTNTVAQDTFQRPDQAFWGTASNGQTWTGDANNVNAFSIVGDAGQLANLPGVFNAILGPATMNAEIVFSASVNHFNPANVNIGAVLRWKDDNNWYKAFINGSELVILKRLNGTTTRLSSVPFNALDATSYTLRFRAIGATLFAKAWPSNQPEPGGWMLTVTDTSTLLLSGSGGLRLAVLTDTVVRATSFLETSVSDTI